MVVLDEPLSSRQHNLLSLPSMRDAGGLKEQRLKRFLAENLALGTLTQGTWLCNTPTGVDVMWLVCKYWQQQLGGAQCSQPSSRILLVTAL